MTGPVFWLSVSMHHNWGVTGVQRGGRDLELGVSALVLALLLIN